MEINKLIPVLFAGAITIAYSTKAIPVTGRGGL
jgi:hypothetical protein